MIKNLENSQIAIIGDDEINDDVVTSCQNLELIISGCWSRQYKYF